MGTEWGAAVTYRMSELLRLPDHMIAVLTSSRSATTQSTSSPVFVKSTKFNDLPDDVKRTLESIE